ncbi:MAG: PBP1A family penicillin-binding protein [Bdellovibrionales bacterium]|nr:PBP1A family penicillin-binding protein [Bdellovibrionales bacterium]
MKLKKILAALIGTFFLGLAAIITFVMLMNSQLPKMISVADYQPLLVSEVFDRSGNKIGEFSREKRTLVTFNEIPKVVVNAFLAAEDSSFFEHGGINYVAIMRAMLANLKAGHKVQGASTITQQVARSLLLTNEKTYTRKVKEILLAYQMEEHLSKEDILYLYLNQIFLGQNAYGIAVAADVYFNKPLKDITLPEAAILAGLPKAPSDANPVRHPHRAKERQRYVLNRMAEEKFITDAEAEAAAAEPVQIYMRKNYWELAPHYLDTVRQMLIAKLGEETVLDKGLRIYTGLDLPKQLEAQKQVQIGLRDLDKRQGYRGPLENTDDVNKIAEILRETRDNLLDSQSEFKLMQPDGTFKAHPPLNLTGYEQTSENKSGETSKADSKEAKRLPVLPQYIKPGEIVKAVVTKVDDEWGLTYVRFAESVGLIDVDSMKWARVPDPNVDVRWATEITEPSKVLKKGDVIQVQVIDSKFHSTVINEKLSDLKKAAAKNKKGKGFEMPASLPNFAEYALVELEQEPLAEAALLSIDQRTDEVIAMVGGYDFNRSQLNRAIQASRQTGSAFKTIVYAAALDNGFTPATAILDAPIVFEEEQEVVGADNADTITKKWKPTNHSNKFVGDILFRNALIQSLNVPSVKIIEKIGVSFAAEYARRLGLFSSLNMDYTLALGSSSVTLYEMTKVFSQLGRLGKKSHPILVNKVEDNAGNEVWGKVYLDERFESQIKPIEDDFERRRLNYLAYERATSAGQPYVLPTPAEGEPPVKNPALEPPLFFKDPEQLMKPETAYVISSLLQSVVAEDGGTGGRARSLGRPTAGKTGTTNAYYDAWFLGYTANIATGVWVGYDHEKTLGKGEVGGRSALPIWVEYMKFAHEGVPPKNFNVPDNIVFASIDNETGRLASAQSKEVVRQAFISGTEPTDIQDEMSNDKDEQQEFYKEDLSE